MKRQNRGSFSDRTAAPAADILAMAPQQNVARAAIVRGLSSHVRRLRKRNQGIPRWLVVAVLAGSVVALAFVQFAIH